MQQNIDAGEHTPEDIAVLAIARGSSQTEAASSAGVHRSTVHRWMQSAEFRDRVADARRGILAQATSKLGDRILTAIDTLASLLESESEAVKLGAARALVTALLPLRQSVDFEERLARLETNR